MMHFCTYFDRHYLSRGLCLYDSLTRQAGSGFHLHILCLDDETRRWLESAQLPQVTLTALSEVEAAEPRLLAARSNRSLIEYYFTLSPIWPLHVLTRHPEMDSVTYLDADLYFLASPRVLFDRWAGRSILIASHGLSGVPATEELYGRFNVSYLSFRNNPEGRRCLEWWRERCLEWCHDRCEDGKFADQKYLDAWPALFPGLAVLDRLGEILAPWNVPGRNISRNGSGLQVDGDPLIYYHFHGLRMRNRWIFRPCPDAELVPWSVIRHVYLPYVHHLRFRERALKQKVKTVPLRLDSEKSISTLSGLRKRQLMVSAPAPVVWLYWHLAAYPESAAALLKVFRRAGGGRVPRSARRRLLLHPTLWWRPVVLCAIMREFLPEGAP